jgi:hypothetical protein
MDGGGRLRRLLFSELTALYHRRIPFGWSQITIQMKMTAHMAGRSSLAWLPAWSLDLWSRHLPGTFHQT